MDEQNFVSFGAASLLPLIAYQAHAKQDHILPLGDWFKPEISLLRPKISLLGPQSSTFSRVLKSAFEVLN